MARKKIEPIINLENVNLVSIGELFNIYEDAKYLEHALVVKKGGFRVKRAPREIYVCPDGVYIVSDYKIKKGKKILLGRKGFAREELRYAKMA